MLHKQQQSEANLTQVFRNRKEVKHPAVTSEKIFYNFAFVQMS